MTIYTFSGGHIYWSPYSVATHLFVSAGPVVVPLRFMCKKFYKPETFLFIFLCCVVLSCVSSRACSAFTVGIDLLLG